MQKSSIANYTKIEIIQSEAQRKKKEIITASVTYRPNPATWTVCSWSHKRMRAQFKKICKEIMA